MDRITEPTAYEPPRVTELGLFGVVTRGGYSSGMDDYGGRS
jgi:hypothetical protein